MELPLVVAFTLIAVLQIAGSYLFIRHHRAIARLNGRMTQVVAGLSLLTDTTETGLRDIATEIGRAGSVQAARAPARAATQRRITGAARRGRSVQEIAAAEQLSEGEVKLRLDLAGGGRRRKKAADATPAN